MQQKPNLHFRNTRSRFYKAQHDPESSTEKESRQENTGQYWKHRGNQEFSKGNIHDALNMYSKAIELDPTESQYFSNRARCYYMMKNFEKALKDSQEAIELDDKNIKGQYLCGCSLAHLAKKDIDKVELGLKKLIKALTMCKGQSKQHFEEQVTLSIYRVKKLKWYLQYEKDLKTASDSIDTVRKVQGDIAANNLKSMLQSRKVKFEIPDQLCCKITLQLIEDPVVSSCGITYERAALLDHFNQNGLKDPFTNKPVSKEIYTNFALKQSIAVFLETNPWAFEYTHGEKASDIKF